MKFLTTSFTFWLLLLLGFLAIILWDDSIEKDIQSRYEKQKMRLTDVHFSELDQGFEQARMYADVVDMDDSQNNMNASAVRTLFFDRLVATRSGELLASWAFKTPFEAKFWGDVRYHSTENQRMRSEEMRYFFSRKEMFTTMPVTIWKDDMVITGRELRYNTQSKEGTLARDVLIRIWETATAGRKLASRPAPLPRLSSPTIDPVFPPDPRQHPVAPPNLLDLAPRFDVPGTESARPLSTPEGK